MNTLGCYARTGSFRRVFSTNSRPIRSTKFIESLLKETREPIWRLLRALNAPGRLVDLPAALDRHGVTVDQYTHWKPILYEPNISAAVTTLKYHGLVVHPEQQTTDIAYHIPSWVVLYLIGYKIRTHQHAATASMDLAYSHLSVAPINVQGPLLILTLLSLARFNLLLPIRQVVDTFLITSLDHPYLYFNLLLQAISSNPIRSVENANTVVSILKSMDARQLQLSSFTYEILLRDRFVTLQLTKYLRERMTHEGFVPKASHLEAYLRVFAKHGAIHDAQEYHEAIRTHTATAPTETETSDVSTDPMHRANTLFLGAHNDRASAFNFLRTLVTPETNEPDKISVPTTRPLQRQNHKVDVYGYTAALSVAARDHSITDTGLINFFERIEASTSGISPTAVTHTILIRGLLRRKSPKTIDYWNKFYTSGLPLDKHSLSLGLQVLTRDGQPHEAFALLEKFASRADTQELGGYQLHQPIVLTSVSMNDFLVALNRIARPDLVFKLWDHMGELYGVFPDARTLSILLQAARLARRLDDTLSGVVTQLALKYPFRQPSETLASRESTIDSITAIVGTTETGIIPYKSRPWHDQLPTDHAIKIFQQAIIGNAPQKLLEIVPPAHAIRSSISDDPMDGFGLPKLGPTKTKFTPPTDLLTEDGRSHYPHIIVTNENCLNCIVLLGLTSRAAEIPLMLAWMRALRVRPTGATLALALVFWSEVSVQAPLIEKWTGGSEKSEYSRLREWMKEWVGNGRVPNERLLGEWHHKVAKLRSTCYSKDSSYTRL